MTSTDMYNLNGRTPFENVMGFTPDISELVEFGWFGWVWYHDPVNFGKDNLGGWLGPAHNVGQCLSYYILNHNAEVIVRSIVSTINQDYMAPMVLRTRQEELTNRVESIIGNFQHTTIQRNEQKHGGMVDVYSDLILLTDGDDDELQVQEYDKDGNPVTKPEIEQINIQDAPNSELTDELINAKVPISFGGEPVEGTVKRRKRDGNSGLLIGKLNPNPMLDTRVYEVEMPDSTYANYHANNIIENIHNSVDDDGHTIIIMDEILNHRSNESAINKRDGWVRTYNGASKGVITTKGWELKVQWMDGSSNWVSLRDIKKFNPVEAAEYTVRSGIANEPAFAW